MTISAGASWTYRTPTGFETSRIVVGAVLRFDSSRVAVCCSVTGAPRRNADGSVDRVAIPFLPLSEAAFRATVVSFDEAAEPHPMFSQKLHEWAENSRGYSTFTVPFEGHLDHLIAQQMADIVAGLAA